MYFILLTLTFIQFLILPILISFSFDEAVFYLSGTAHFSLLVLFINEIFDKDKSADRAALINRFLLNCAFAFSVVWYLTSMICFHPSAKIIETITDCLAFVLMLLFYLSLTSLFIREVIARYKKKNADNSILKVR